MQFPLCPESFDSDTRDPHVHFALQLRAAWPSDVVAQARPGLGWGVQQYIFTADDDSRASMMTDTTVAVAPTRHSLRINLPTSNAVVLALPGQQLVKPTTSGWCMPAWNCKAAVPGQVVVGSSATLPSGKSFRVSVSILFNRVCPSVGRALTLSTRVAQQLS